jgi:hypothetical protein
MAEPSTLTENYQPSIHHPRHRRTRALAVGCALVVVVGLCVISYRVIANSRYKVVGKVDPKSDYRIEFTVSSRYSQSDPSGKPDQQAWLAEFKPKPNLVQWLLTNIMHRPLIGEPLYFRESHGTIGADEGGYPHVSSLGDFSTHDSRVHMLISGCPATWFVSSTSGHWIYSLSINLRNQSMNYSFYGTGDTANLSDIKYELLKIKDSVRITKVK